MQAPNAWISGGGGLRTLIGYGPAQERENVNTLLQPLGVSYDTAQILQKQGGSTFPIIAGSGIIRSSKPSGLPGRALLVERLVERPQVADAGQRAPGRRPAEHQLTSELHVLPVRRETRAAARGAAGAFPPRGRRDGGGASRAYR